MDIEAFDTYWAQILSTAVQRAFEILTYDSVDLCIRWGDYWNIPAEVFGHRTYSEVEDYINQ